MKLMQIKVKKKGKKERKIMSKITSFCYGSNFKQILIAEKKSLLVCLHFTFKPFNWYSNINSDTEINKDILSWELCSFKLIRFQEKRINAYLMSIWLSVTRLYYLLCKSLSCVYFSLVKIFNTWLPWPESDMIPFLISVTNN